MISSHGTSAMVLDTSAAIAFLRAEPTQPMIDAAIEKHRADRGRILVPDVFWLELTNVLVRRYRLLPNDVVGALRAIDGLEIESVRQDRPQLLLGFDLAIRHGLSTYDASYLALAQVEDASLLTLDRRLASAAGERAISVAGLSHRTGEAPATYLVEPVDWTRFGPYLAQLRAEAR